MADIYDIELSQGMPKDVSPLVGKSGVDLLGRPFFMQVVIGGYRLPNEPLITINRQKRIVETVLTGDAKKGSVKELISSKDYRIKIEGIILGKKSYPQEAVEQLMEVLEMDEAIEIENELAAIFNIHKIVVTGYGFGKMAGSPYAQTYYINAVSDEDFYAILKK